MGLFIAIEGGDGSGKGTQAVRLEERALQEGIDVFKISFPQYDKPSARLVANYLNGKYGGANDVHPELTSLPYAIDRFAAKQEIIEHLSQPNTLVITDRYVASNLAHQGTKLTEAKERQLFYVELMDIEYGLLGIPKPDRNLVLLVPSTIAQKNVDKKTARSYTNKKRDIHESSTEHLELAKANYQELCMLYPAEFTAIECMEDVALRSIDAIHEDIWRYVQQLMED